MTTLPTISDLEFGHEFPASRAQQQMLEDRSALARVRVVRFDGEMDREAFTRGIELLVDRHEALRTLLRKQDGAPGRGAWRQLVLEQSSAVLEFVDDRSSVPTAQAGTLDRILERERNGALIDAGAQGSSALFRAILIAQHDTQHVCVLTANAAVLDIFSFEILLEDLRHLYATEVSGSTGPVREPGLQYADWTLWEAATRQQQRALPSSRARQVSVAADQGRPAGYAERLLSRELEERLLQAGSQESLAIPLTAAMAVYCRRAGLAAPAVLTSGRRLSELKQAIGPFQLSLDTVPANPSGDLTFAAAAAAVRAAMDTHAARPDAASPLGSLAPALVIADPLLLVQPFAPGLQVCWAELATQALAEGEPGAILTVRLLTIDGHMGLGFWSRSLSPAQLDHSANAYLSLLQQLCDGDPMPAPPEGESSSAPSDDPEAAPRLYAAAYQPPQGETESRLAEIWSAVLQVSQVGRNENFFDLGGHSLLAVRIGTRIERAFGKEVPLNAVLELPTIAEFATLLAPSTEQAKAPEDGPESQHRLVTLQEPAEGTQARTAFFWIPGGRAISVLALREVSLLLGADRPVYGVESRLPQHGQSFLSVPERARLYLEVIRRRQPRGPYLLAGFCVGGMVAFEMAQQLRHQGEEVAFLGLLQASVPGFPGTPAQRRYMERQRMSYLGRTMLDFLLMRLSPLHQRRPREQRQQVLDRFAKLLTGWVGTSSHLPELTQETNGRAMQVYRPAMYDGALHIFLAEDCFESAGITPALDPRRAWASLARGGAVTTVVPGDHVTMLTQAPARSLAEAIRAALPL